MNDEKTPVAVEKTPVAVEKPRRKPAFIKVAKAWGNFPADSVLAVSEDLLAQLDKDGVTYREATDFERRVGGFPD